MPSAKLTSKGQITIPVQIRTALGLDAGDKIDFFEIEKGQYAIKPRTEAILEAAAEGYLASVGDESESLPKGEAA